jgi:hypothetical protein
MEGKIVQARWQPLPQEQVAKLSKDEALAYQMGEIAEDIAQKFLEDDILMDFSEDSLHLLERFLGKLYKSIPRGFFAKITGKAWSEDRIFQTGGPLGAYLGEVIRINLAAQWCSDHPLYPGQDGAYMRTAGGMAIAPISKVFKRLADGPADDVVSYYRMLKIQREQK